MVKKQSRVTLQQVADHAGVSRATASLVVRGRDNISKEKRELVLQSMKELGYIYDRVAANLRSRHSSTVGLIISEIGNPFFSELLVGVHQALDKKGYTVILGTTFDSMSKQDVLLSTMLEHRVGGVIISPTPGTSFESIERLEKWGIPVVVVTRETLSQEKMDYIGADNVTGAELAVNHLLSKGHRRIAFLGGSSSSVYRDRVLGYANALGQAGIEVDESLMIEGPVSRRGGMEAIKQVITLSDPPTAAFCYNDIVAFGVMMGLREKGYTVGQDFAVVGFDNIQEASIISPGLTTVDAFPQKIGMYASDLLNQRINGLDEGPKRIILPPDLVVRESSSFTLLK
ncbi:LacI family DNA-binding transcriptional regulator [Ammoniphilus sp. 3BR4]|uniref:LacI family DNA-binding transcriptional regulator n=1 Tax=Ammoniphilus sp. 3BR4 TaxID=3158265 RepID=UPI003467CD60